MIMRAESEAHAGCPYPREVGGLQILLAEMNEVATFLDRQAPMVVDDELAVVLGAQGLCLADLRAQLGLIHGLDAKLNQLDAEQHQPFDPGSALDNQVEGIELHEKTALPIVGVDGTATSRGSSIPEQKASRPASTALPNARAMPTGSAALATAVFRSTASKPSSMTVAACDGRPSPASTISGTPGKCPRIERSAVMLTGPRAEPIGAHHGIRTLQPAASSRSATTRSSVV